MARLIVFCPGNYFTGGPEALHQLVDMANEVGIPAFVHYYDAGKGLGQHDEFSRYYAPITAELRHGDVIVVPETELRRVEALVAQGFEVYVWWLSVHHGLKALETVGSRMMLKVKHLAQSRFAANWLVGRGLVYQMLGDYTRVGMMLGTQKKSQVAYNPAKYVGPTLETFPSITFVPLQEMTHAEVINTLRESKVYFDYGYHPGKDRLPREAAQAGCVVVTNRFNAAGNCEDIPIPDFFKVSSDGEIQSILEYALAEDCDKEFDLYRRVISSEFEEFKVQVHRVFGGIW